MSTAKLAKPSEMETLCSLYRDLTKNGICKSGRVSLLDTTLGLKAHGLQPERLRLHFFFNRIREITVLHKKVKTNAFNANFYTLYPLVYL